nr:hypothetical protein [Tanacetum cinerariifolium]
MTLPNPQRHVVPAVVLTQSKPVPITVVRPVSTVVPKISVTRPRQAKTVVTKFNSPPKRLINHSPSPKASNSPPRVTAVKAPMVNAAKGMQGKWEWRPKCLILDHVSRNTSASMTLKRFDYNDALGRSKTGKLDFDDVYFVKELKFNLFSISQMCDKKNSVLFTDTECLVLSPEFKLPDENQVLLRVPRENNMYNVNLKNIVPFRDLTCLFAKETIDESNLWHRRLGHINFKTMSKLIKDDYSSFTWVFFLATKDETSPILNTFSTGLENQLSLKVKVIRSDNGTEFKNHDLNQFCGKKGIKREFSVPRTPQQNGIAERKNMTLIEAAKTMLADSLLPIPFWAEAVNTAFLAENQSNTHAGFQDTEKAEEVGTQTYVLFPVLSDGSINLKNNNKDALVDGKEHDDDIQKSISPNIHSSSCGDQTRKQGDKTENKDKVYFYLIELPLDPSLTRTLIEANKNDFLPQALTVAAMLSVEGTLLPGRTYTFEHVA